MPSSIVLPRPLAHATEWALIAAIYFVAARLSLALAIPPGYATAVWPPSGIALAAALLFGSRIWPGIWIGAALANVVVESSFLSAVWIASGNTLEALAAAALIRRYVAAPGRFQRGEEVLTFIALCALSATIAASLALVPLAAGHALSWGEALRNWWTWWQGDVGGMLIVAPLILSWSVSDPLPWPRKKKLELGCFAALLFASGLAISSSEARPLAPFALTFLTLPFILWAAFRFGQREVTTAIAVACATAVWYTLERPELFASVARNELLLVLLTFISMVVATGLVLATVVDERRRATEDMRRRHDELLQKRTAEAHHDPLTGLANGGLFRERLAGLAERAGQSGRKVAVALMDIERFKAINDTYGGQAGDELLRQLARRLSLDAADGSVLARIGADRFAIAVPGIESARAAARLPEERLARCFAQPYPVGGRELRIAARMGLALAPDDGTDPGTLFMHAESALKKAKASGERHLFYTREMSHRTAQRLSLENDLRRAIDREEFVLHYQPKLNLATGQVAGLEALLRWHRPEHGLVPPLEFVPLLEETGLILEAGRWALRKAVLDHGAWRAQGIPVPRIAVNVSPIQLRQRDFVDLAQEAIGAAAGAQVIDLEITESCIMEDIEANIAKLRQLRSWGIGIAIDDFGTGYSSLGYLAKLPVDTLKIDRSFIITMLHSVDTMTLVSTIISLAHALKLKVVAEGVESGDQAKVLRLLRCDEMQGYLYSKALPAQALVELLRNGAQGLPAAAHPAEAARRPRILVIDDDESMRELVRLHLRNAGYDVVLAENAIVAGHLVQRSAPDLIVADVEMPYMDGFQFVEGLKANAAFSAIPVLFLTIRTDGESRARQLGAAAFLTKPLQAERLLAAVAKHLPQFGAKQ
jgi:diguanylate cyclase (GGDEF)-like protein